MTKKKTDIFDIKGYRMPRTSRKVRIGKGRKSGQYFVAASRKVGGKEISCQLNLTGKSFGLLVSALNAYVKEAKETTVWTHKNNHKIPKGGKVKFKTFNFNITEKKSKKAAKKKSPTKQK